MKKALQLLSSAALSVAMLAASNALADRFVLDYHGQEFRGQDRIVRIKQALKERYRNIHWQDYELETVLVEAKSRQGRGMIELLIGQSPQDRARVAGNPRSYDRNRAHTYDRILLQNFERNITQPRVWRLRLSGHIKLNRVIVDAEPTLRRRPDRPDRPDRPGRPGRGGLEIIDLGTHTADRFLADTKNFNVDERGVVEVRLLGVNGQMDVQRVTLRYRDGRSLRLSQLEGSLYQGQRKRVRIRRGVVDEISVTATSPYFFGDRGKLRLQVGVFEDGRRRRRR